MTRRRNVGGHVLLVTALIVAGLGVAGRAAAQHPLDPLSADEIRAATAVIRTDARLARARLPFMSVAEPAKADVLAWRAGQGQNQGPPQSLARRAHAVAVTDAGVFEAVVDLGARRLAAVTPRPGAQGPVTFGDTADASRIALADPRFQQGLRARGITDVSKTYCAPWTTANYGIPAYQGKRVLIVGCFDTRRATNNHFGWPIERLYAAVDLKSGQVIEVVDGGPVAPTPGDQNFRAADVGPLREPRTPTRVAQPRRSSVRIDGHQVRWGNWRFHVRVDPRVGPVVSLVRWQDAGRERSVLYQGFMSEMFVPYMDPAFGWYSRTFFDAGEYGAGLMASRLTSGVDCPASATFLPATFNTEEGEAMTNPRALCVFERDRGEPIWRHGEEGRPDVELVVRMAAEVGNYDYLLDWVFNDAAEIDLRVGATGIIALKGVAALAMTDASAREDTRYGTLVAPGLVGVSHDHHFNFRLDFDVDGSANSFLRQVYRPTEMPAGTPRRSLYVVEPVYAERERTAHADVGHGSEKVLVVNEGRTNGVGHAVGYEIVSGSHGAFLLDPADVSGSRARFLDHDVWVTQYDPAERHAAGDYVFGTRDVQGLPVWADQDRPVRRQDLVAWVNLSLQHLTRAEDQPVMPTLWHAITLRPFNFFDRNPALDLPPQP